MKTAFGVCDSETTSPFMLLYNLWTDSHSSKAVKSYYHRERERERAREEERERFSSCDSLFSVKQLPVGLMKPTDLKVQRPPWCPVTS